MAVGGSDKLRCSLLPHYKIFTTQAGARGGRNSGREKCGECEERELCLTISVKTVATMGKVGVSLHQFYIVAIGPSSLPGINPLMGRKYSGIIAGREKIGHGLPPRHIKNREQPASCSRFSV